MENVEFLKNMEKVGPKLICFLAGHCATLTKKLWLGNHGHIDFMSCDSISGVVLIGTQTLEAHGFW